MDVTIVRAITELLMMTIPAIIVGVGGLLLLSRSHLGKAVARRIAGDSYDPAYQEQLDALQDDVLGLRSQLSEMQERIEFAERLLSRPNGDPAVLDPPADQVQGPAQQGRH
jgi:hypothetical protein